MINNSPFETGISRICRGDMDKNYVKSPVSDGQLLMVSRPHFFFFDFSGDFFEISEKSKKNRPKNPWAVEFGRSE